MLSALPPNSQPSEMGGTAIYSAPRCISVSGAPACHRVSALDTTGSAWHEALRSDTGFLFFPAAAPAAQTGESIWESRMATSLQEPSCRKENEREGTRSGDKGLSFRPGRVCAKEGG